MRKEDLEMILVLEVFMTVAFMFLRFLLLKM